MKHIAKFNNESDIQTALNNGNLVNPYIASYGNNVDYNSKILYKNEYLTFEITSPGVIRWGVFEGSFSEEVTIPLEARLTIQYSKNSGEWTNITSSSGDSAPTISVATGDSIQFRGDNTGYGVEYNDRIFNSGFFSGIYDENEGIIIWKTTCGFRVKGNIMSLINSTNFATLTTFDVESIGYTFSSLFDSCDGLTDASNLILPATTLTNGCYNAMFSRCTSLTTAPELPAITLARNCYGGMFNGCTSLVTAPEISATTLKELCYQSMFNGCTSLITAPELPATTLVNYCYRSMFRGCTNLNYIKCLATNISANYCTTNWVSNVASSGTFVKNPAMSSWTTGDSGIPTNWTVQDAA